MDNFHEEIVVRKNRGLLDITYILAYTIMLVAACIALLNFQNLLVAGDQFLSVAIIFVISAGCAVGLWFVKDQLRIEYEYTFTNGELDFAQVLNNKKRKHLFSLNAKNIERMAPVDDGQFQNYYQKSEINKLKLMLNRGTKKYYLYTTEGKSTLLILEPSQTLVDLIAQYAGKHKVQV